MLPNPQSSRLSRLVALGITAALSMASLAQDGGKIWSTAVSTRPADGRQIIFRFIQEFEPAFSRSAYPDRVVLVWRYKSESGMPSRAERESMDQFEDLLSPGLQQDLLASLVLVSTGNDLREWTYYTRSEKEFMVKLNATLRQNARLPVEVYAAKDPKWSAYETFRRSMKR